MLDECDDWTETLTIAHAFWNSSLRKGLLSSSLDISISYKITTWAYCELVHKLMFSQSINQSINQSISLIQAAWPTQEK